VTGNTVVAGGAEFVSGTASGTTVGSGGFQFVQGSGHANSTTVSGAGAFEVVNSGGFASNAIVESGGTINVSAGGVMSNTVVSSGGTEVISTGGTLSGATLSGGHLEIQSGGTAGSSTITISNGVLVLDDSVNFSGSIAGLLTSAQVVDLADIAFGSSGPTLGYSNSGTSGTLTANDGTHVATLNLIGTYVVGDFKTANDGHGGTRLTDPPVSSGAGIVSPH
jgi:autotransporter passenger strand-loop-strand repeat protein